jgi:hypothetical protein
MQRAHLFLPVLAAILLLPASALAHAIGVTCTIRGDKVEVEAFYDDDMPAHKAKVQVVNAKEEVIANGIADKDGIWSFVTPTPGTYEIRVDAGAGHRAKKTLHIPGMPTTEEETPIPTEPEPTREQMTRTPWWRIGLGLLIIVVGSAAAFGVMQWRAANQKR